jgi:hypothetical protein
LYGFAAKISQTVETIVKRISSNTAIFSRRRAWNSPALLFTQYGFLGGREFAE